MLAGRLRPLASNPTARTFWQPFPNGSRSGKTDGIIEQTAVAHAFQDAEASGHNVVRMNIEDYDELPRCSLILAVIICVAFAISSHRTISNQAHSGAWFSSWRSRQRLTSDL